ncbi:deoxyribodipyrimidine photo-lyase [Flagellimonas sp. CMM7]|uniref:cryptochrome/photolyase family protein n=1 Tax=Flagellimonas sp. CMM7 TaxID=2654676 RepID=UPI0013D43924|nr:deoxyribodipyrimidine photo-lyase [Flagellimonas sp. CMM7]UII79814.1 DNA photolyase family protein [Flagellimonas sp. CMM7]
MKDKVSIFWFRRDLRLDDNVGLYQALQTEYPVLPIFIFDTEILEKLPKNDARVSFFHEQLQKMKKELQNKFESGIGMYKGNPLTVFEQLLKEFTIDSVFANHDYEPYARDRDRQVQSFLEKNDINFHTFKDQIIFEKNDILKNDRNPYVVYTPYKNRWKENFNPSLHLIDYDTFSNFHKLYQKTNLPNIELSDIGFESSDIQVPDFKVTPYLIQHYEETRNFPSKENGTSRLGPYLRFGTVSIRKMMKKAIAEENEVFWNELIWREFFMQILWHFPNTVNNAFKPKYDRIVWRNNEAEFELWKKGQTGYPLVDAGMRELNTTGFMHNRVRMLTASFLCKHLLIDWRWGEAYFAEKLLDYDLASNIGNWQWASGSGVDAAPYFRIFNPTTQVDKFDGKKEYINKWVPELQDLTYPSKMVDHKMARERCLKVYKEAVG